MQVSGKSAFGCFFSIMSVSALLFMVYLMRNMNTPAFQQISPQTRTWLWAVLALFLVFDLLILVRWVMAYKKKQRP